MNRLFIENSNSVLRKILNNEDNTEILENLIESIIHIKIKKIIMRPYIGEKVKYLPAKEKYGIINIRVIDEKDKQYNIGFQIIDGFFMQEKLLTYAATIHVNQVEYDDYNKIEPTITINIIDFKGFDTSICHKIVTFSQRDENNRIQLRDEVKIHVLELPDFNKEVAKTPEEEWIQYFKGRNTKDIEEIKRRNKAINMLDNKIKEYWKQEKI